MAKQLAIGLNAGNDKNGNPRRCWVVMSTDGGIVGVLDEDYIGVSALHKCFPDAIEGPKFETTVAEYKSLVRHYNA